jgi:hypothetical protein
MKNNILMDQKVKNIKRHDARVAGSVLLVAMGFITVISLTLASLYTYTGSETQMVSRRTSQMDALYGSEAVTRRAMAQVKSLFFQSYSTNSYMTGSYAAPTDAVLNALSSPTSVGLLNSSFTITTVSNFYTTGTSANRYVTTTIAANDPDLTAYSGLSSSRATIECRASVQSKTERITNVTANVSHRFNIDYIPVFQYAVFYNMDMEIFNGPAMTLNGKVHCNGTLYYAPASTLAITDNLTVAGDIERGLKKWDSTKTTTFSSMSASAQTAYRDAEFPTGTLNNATGVAYTDAERTTLAQNRWPIDPDNFVNDVPGDSYGTASFTVKKTGTTSQVDFRTATSPLTYFDSDNAGWAGGALTKWNGGVKSTAQGIDAVPAPVSADVLASATDPNNPYHTMVEAPVLDSNGMITDSANVKQAKMGAQASIIIQRSGSAVNFKIRGTDGAFHQVNNLRGAAAIVTNVTSAVANVRNADGTTILHDQREYLQNGSRKMAVTEFNVNAFLGGGSSTAGATDSSGVWKTSAGANVTTDALGNTFTPVDFDGTIYIYDDGYSSTRRPGIRIKNAATLYDKDSNATANNGLTIISENPVYVQGNFNADGNVTTGPEKSGASYESRPPASIVADSFSILSTSWISGDDNPGSGTFNASTYGGRSSAASTEVNAAILAGVNQSNQSLDTGTFSYNGTTGGLNNFPKFLEHWSGTFKYSGSMVSLWFAKQAAGQYRSAGTSQGVFSAPTRDWAFNTQYLNPNSLPRLTPIVRVYSTADWSNF